LLTAGGGVLLAGFVVVGARVPDVGINGGHWGDADAGFDCLRFHARYPATPPPANAPSHINRRSQRIMGADLTSDGARGRSIQREETP
jgi:hypothetical protein